jgi:hypothetical protein
MLNIDRLGEFGRLWKWGRFVNLGILWKYERLVKIGKFGMLGKTLEV